MTNLTLPIFTDAEKARIHLENLHWPDGAVCPHCHSVGNATLVKGKSHRPGLYQCNSCREPFTVTVGTVMEKSHIPLNKWVLGFHLMAASKKGVSAHQLMRMLGLGSYRTAWFMAHRIREAMAPLKPDLMGGPGSIVEADETEISKSPKSRPRTTKNKKFMALVERGGRVRSRVLTGAEGSIVPEIRRMLKDRMDPKSVLHTDGHVAYRIPFVAAKHEVVDHYKQMARTAKDGTRVHCNSAEGYFSIFKRGLVGTYQHMSEQHLPRYLNEFDFRMSNRARLGVNDTMRAELAIKGARDKRLTYR